MKRRDAPKNPLRRKERQRARTRERLSERGPLGDAVVGLVEHLEPGQVRVRLPQGEVVSCRVLRTSEAARLVLAQGHEVLVALLGRGTGCVLGRVEPYDPRPLSEVHLTATEKLVLDCGESSVELNARGKVATRGVDVLSSAKRRNRVNGGSVEIN